MSDKKKILFTFQATTKIYNVTVGKKFHFEKKSMFNHINIFKFKYQRTKPNTTFGKYIFVFIKITDKTLIKLFPI